MVKRIREVLEQIAEAQENGADAHEVLRRAGASDFERGIADCRERLERLRVLCPQRDLACLSSHVKRAAELLGAHERTAPWIGHWE